MRRETRVQLIAVLLLVGFLTASAFSSASIAASLGRNKLTFADTAEEGDPPQVALGIAMGAFRGFFVNYLWIRANQLKEAGRYHEAVNLSRAITTLQPRFPRVWAFHSWNMAYNISVTAQTPEERWQWVTKGVRLLRDEGIAANPNELLLYKELAWIFQHKIQGFTDESNQYYKRALAAEWTYVLGPPPKQSPDMKDRDTAIERYAEWLTAIADAPSSLEVVEAQDPLVAQLASELRELFNAFDYDFLERYEIQRSVEGSIYASQLRADMGPRSQRLSVLLEDETYAEAWPKLINTVRKRILTREYRMQPRRMIRYTRKFGPIDWRNPAAHGLYWSHKGAEEAEKVVTDTNAGDMDIVNIDRQTVQCIQELWRHGDMYFDPLDFLFRREGAMYLALPNVHFIPSYADAIDEMRDRAGIFEKRERAYSMFSAGYENFLKDSIRFLYRRGQREEAEELYTRLRFFEERAINVLQDEYAATLDEFIEAQFADERFKTPQVANSEIYGSLQGAYAAGLLGGDTDLFRSQIAYAARFHAGYFNYQFRQTAGSRDTGRMEIMPRDFDYLAGTVLTSFIQLLSLDDAETVFNNAPLTLKRYAYLVLEPMFKESITAAVEQAGSGRTFEEIFPEPSGMAEFLVEFQRKSDERRREFRVEGNSGA